jgi:hypothetical protein
VKAGNVPVVLLTLNRGDVIELVGEFDADHYIAKVGDVYGMVEKNLVRTASQEAYASWTGYAYGGVAVYSDLYLRNVAATLALNTTVEVVEDLGYGYLVNYNGDLVFMRAGSLSRNKIVYAAPSGGSDGGDISLGGIGGFQRLSVLVPRDGAVTGKVQILVDRASILLGWFDRGDPVPVITESGFLEEKEGFVPVYLEGFAGYVRQELLRTPETEAYTAWEGYARSGAEVYGSYYLDGEALVSLSGNTRVQILEDLGFCYLVTAGETTGYMEKEQISETKINYSTGGGGEWSDPVM